MTTYIGRHLIQMLPIALGLAALIFLLIHLIPGDPALVILGPHATPGQVARLHAYWHLDDPLWTQFYFYINRLLHGDLGTSIVYQDSVLDLLVGRMPVTLLLAFLSMLLSVALAVPLAVVAVVTHDRAVDRGLRLLTFVGFAMPSFWLAMLLMILFGVNLHWLPVAGYGTTFGDHLYHLILPIVVVSLSIFPLLLRTLRASLLEVVGQDYVRTARAKGLAARRVLFKHVLRNALLPTITIVGLNLGSLLSGAVVIESVFALPGVGYLLTASVTTRDYPAVQGAALALGMLYVVVNMVTDLSYSFADPRILRT
jgi:peptide/nickel transport system permease protein